MSIKTIIIFLLLGAVAMSGISCGTGFDGSPEEMWAREVTWEQITNMLPFTAKVELIRISRYSDAGTYVRVQLKRPDKHTRLDLDFWPAGDSDINFALCLQEGRIYQFPKVFEDYRHGDVYTPTNRVTRAALKPVDFVPNISTNK